VHTQLFGQLGGRRGTGLRDVGGHLHSVRKPCCYLRGPHTVCGPLLVGCKLVKVTLKRGKHERLCMKNRHGWAKHHRTSITAVNDVPGCPEIPGMNMYIPEFPGMEKGVRE